MSKHRILLTRGDVAVLSAAVLTLGFLFSTYWIDGKAADQIEIRVGNDEHIHVSLLENQVLNISGTLGDTKIEVRNGKVRFRQSPCDGKQCIHSGWASRSGEVIACLPNRVILSVLGSTQSYDAINF